MKKHLLTMALGLLMSASAFAQVEFVDAAGNVIPDGSTVVRNEIEKPMPVLDMYQIPSGISAKNTSSSAVSVKSQVDVTDLPFGSFSLCFPGSCWITVGTYTGTYPTHQPTQKNLEADGPWTSSTSESIPAGSTKSLSTEWKLNSLGMTTFDPAKDKGSFTATYSLLVDDQKVSTIKVLYTTDPDATGIAGVTVNNGDKKVVATYNAAGQEVSASHKGLAIVKYSDGSTRKVVIK